MAKIRKGRSFYFRAGREVSEGHKRSLQVRKSGKKDSSISFPEALERQTGYEIDPFLPFAKKEVILNNFPFLSFPTPGEPPLFYLLLKYLPFLSPSFGITKNQSNQRLMVKLRL